MKFFATIAAAPKVYNTYSAARSYQRVTANLQTWLDGTFHGVRKKHLQAYLDEYMFRFNRRFYRQVSFRKQLELGARWARPLVIRWEVAA